MTDELPMDMIGAAAVLVTTALMLAPPFPPPLAIVSGVGLVAIALLVWFGYHHAVSELLDGWRQTELDEFAEEPPEMEDVRAIQQRYADDEITEESMERQIEDVLSDAYDVEETDPDYEHERIQ